MTTRPVEVGGGLVRAMIVVVQGPRPAVERVLSAVEREAGRLELARSTRVRALALFSGR